MNTAGTTLTLKGIVSGSSGLVTSGPGTLILDGANTYGGGTTVTSGTVQVGNVGALGAGAGNLTVNAGTVDLHGFSPAVRALSGNAGALITNAAAGAATLTVAGAEFPISPAR